MIEMFKMPVKLGMTAHKHILTQNAAFMEWEGYEAKKQVKRMKKELTASMKIIKEFQTISTTTVDLKKQASFHVGWELMKEQLKSEMMETIEKLLSQIYSLLEEGVEIRELKSQITAHLKKMDGYLPNVTQLQHIFANRPKHLVYYHEFMHQQD